jgi:hypothetical protein
MIGTTLGHYRIVDPKRYQAPNTMGARLQKLRMMKV